MDKTKIAWTDATWNPIRGCSRVSKGCENCYAEKVAARFSGPGLPYEGTITPGTQRWNGKIRLVPKVLDQPLRWKKPRRIFVNSMSDLFHEGVPDKFIDRVFAVMAICGADRNRCFRHDCDHEGFDCERNGRSPVPQPIHTFQILTKRPERMRAYLTAADVHERILDASQGLGWTWPGEIVETAGWPLRNVWLGVSTENQETADERIPLLLQTPAAVRFVSAEPLLGALRFSLMVPESCTRYEPMTGEREQWSLVHNTLTGFCATSPCSGMDGPKLDWVIVGGESGPGARPCNVEWIREIVGQCRDARVPCFVKQLGANYCDEKNGVGGFQSRAPKDLGISIENLRSKKGDDPIEWPEDLRVQEFPS